MSKTTLTITGLSMVSLYVFCLVVLSDISCSDKAPVLCVPYRCNRLLIVWFEVLTAVFIMLQVCWGVSPCVIVNIQVSKELFSSETSVTYKSTQRDTPEVLDVDSC